MVVALSKVGLLNKEELAFIAFANRSGIRWADVTRRIPEADGSVEVLYSCHMVEHLDRDEIVQFLKEAHRVLASGGVLRSAVPDIHYHVDNYLQDGDADRFIQATRLASARPKTLLDKLRLLVLGGRGHLWMYDGDSLCKLLAASGFRNPQVMPPGATMIADPGQLDLRERTPESVFVEGINP